MVNRVVAILLSVFLIVPTAVSSVFAVNDQITFTAQSITVDATNVASFRQSDGSFVVPVSIIASGISADNGMAAFTFTPSTNAAIESINPGSAISDSGQFQIGNDNKVVWVDSNEITAATAEIAIVNLEIPHSVAAGTSYSLTLTLSSDPDDYLLIDLSNYDPIVVNATVTFSVSGHVAKAAANENVVSATCTAGGSYDEVVRCTYCNAVMSSTHRTTNALGHSFGAWSVTTPATCTAAGVESRTCSRCSTTETRAISALGHDYSAVVTPATCTAGGYTTHTCSRCGDHYVTDETEALGHSFGDWVETTPATTTSTGVETRTCSRCGATETREIPMITANPTFELTADPITVKPGGTVDIAVVMDSNPAPGISSYSWILLYDTSAFAIGPGLNRTNFKDNISEDDGGVEISMVSKNARIAGQVKFNFAVSNDDIKTGTGLVAIITLNVDADAPEGSYTFTLKGDLKSSANAVKIAEIDVEVAQIMYGDANGDGVVDLDDAVAISDYDAGLISLEDLSPGADANGDGVVDLDDAVAICDYDAGLLTLDDFGPQA